MEKVYIYGKWKKLLDIIKDVIGEELNVCYLIEYLLNKYLNFYLL